MPPKRELTEAEKQKVVDAFRKIAQANIKSEPPQAPKRVKTKKKPASTHKAFSEPTLETKQETVVPKSRKELRSGDLIFQGKYRVEKALGQGSFGVVYRCTIVATGETVAVKIVRVDTAAGADIDEDLINEVTVQQKLTPHPNLVPLLDVAWDRPLGWIGVVMPFARWGDLKTHLDRLLQSESASPKSSNAFLDIRVQLGSDVLCGLAHMHKNGVVHQDLKPENILVFDHPNPRYTGHVVCKIADFGFSMRLQSTIQFRWPVVSPIWRAPEIDCIQDDITVYTTAADVWSLGVIYLELFLGNTEFAQVKTTEELTPLRLKIAGATSSDVARDSACERTWRALSQPAPNKTWKDLEAKLTPDRELADALAKYWTAGRYAELWTVIFDCLQYNPRSRLSTSDLQRLPLWKTATTCASERNLTTKELQDSEVHINRMYELASEFKMSSKLLKEATSSMDIGAAIMVRFAIVRPESMLNSWKGSVRSSYKLDTVLLAICFYLGARTTQDHELSEFLASKMDLLVKEKRWIGMQLDVLNALGWNIDGQFDPAEAKQEYCSSFVPGLFSLPDAQVEVANLKDKRPMAVSGVKLVPKDKTGNILGSFVFEEPKSATEEEHWVDQSSSKNTVYSTSGLFDSKFCSWQREGKMTTIDIHLTLKDPVTSLTELLKTQEEKMVTSLTDLYKVKLFYHQSEWRNPKVPEELPTNVFSSSSTNWVLELDTSSVTLSWELQILYL